MSRCTQLPLGKSELIEHQVPHPRCLERASIRNLTLASADASSGSIYRATFSVALFGNALAEDPLFGAAYAGLGDAYLLTVLHRDTEACREVDLALRLGTIPPVTAADAGFVAFVERATIDVHGIY